MGETHNVEAYITDVGSYSDLPPRYASSDSDSDSDSSASDRPPQESEIPRLSDVLTGLLMSPTGAVTPGDFQVTIELKHPCARLLADLLSSYPKEAMGRVVVSSFKHYLLPCLSKSGVTTGSPTFPPSCPSRSI